MSLIHFIGHQHSKPKKPKKTDTSWIRRHQKDIRKRYKRARENEEQRRKEAEEADEIVTEEIDETEDFFRIVYREGNVVTSGYIIDKGQYWGIVHRKVKDNGSNNSYIMQDRRFSISKYDECRNWYSPTIDKPSQLKFDRAKEGKDITSKKQLKSLRDILKYAEGNFGFTPGKYVHESPSTISGYSTIIIPEDCRGIRNNVMRTVKSLELTLEEEDDLGISE